MYLYVSQLLTMFMLKKMILAPALLLALSAYADVRVVGQINVTRNAQTRAFDFDAIISEQNYDSATTLCTDAVGKLDVKVIATSDDEATLEFSAIDAEGNVVSNPVLRCAWDVEASVSIGKQRDGVVIDETAIIATVSRN